MTVSTNFSHNLDAMPLMDLSSTFIAELDEPMSSHRGCDIFQNASDDMSRLFNILECAENVLSMDDHSAAVMQILDFSLEPTPIGPRGIQRVVTMPEIMPPSSVASLMEIFRPTRAVGSMIEANMKPAKRQRVSCNVLEPCLQTNRRTLPPSTEELPQMPDGAEKVEDADIHFRSYQSDQWLERFQDLVEFKEKHGHCLVPHNYPPNQQLAQWTKRQRYQYKLKKLGRHSTLTDEREKDLEKMRFVWNSHRAAWEERFYDLKLFSIREGHCNVPSNYEAHKLLAVWVKCQRRQMKLYRKGLPSTMTVERMQALETLGFDWNPRNL